MREETMPKPSMRQLKEELYRLAQECVAGTYEGWTGLGRAPRLGDPPELDQAWYRELGARFMFAHIAPGARHAEHVRARANVVHRLTDPHYKGSVCRDNGIRELVEHYPLVSGALDRMPEAPGEADHDAAVLGEVALTLLHEESRLRYLIRLTIMLTQRYRRVNMSDLEQIACDEQEVANLAARVHSRWYRNNVSPSMVALPHGPMSTLTRESTNLGTLVRDGSARWREAGAKYHEDEDGRQLALVFDKKLVLKGNDVDDTYMQLPLEGQLDAKLDAVGALTHVLMRQYQDTFSKDPRESQIARFTEDIPRVVAGMFLVATRDAQLSFLHSGEFVDSESAVRLTEVVGLDASQKRCRDRVAAVRGMLESIELSRSVRGENGNSVTWTGPIIQRLKDKVDASVELPDGLGRARKRLGVWRIAPELWRMQDPDGKSASFMLLDHRAFGLDTRTSKPFNLYWTIIQRAYNARRADDDVDRFDADGAFSPTLRSLYMLSGIDGKSDEDNPRRVRANLEDLFDRLVENDLIEGYDRGVFASPGSSLQQDLSRRVSIRLPTSVLRYLPDKAFRDGKNTFKVGRLSS
jgi:hypothetical protein